MPGITMHQHDLSSLNRVHQRWQNESDTSSLRTWLICMAEFLGWLAGRVSHGESVRDSQSGWIETAISLQAHHITSQHITHSCNLQVTLWFRTKKLGCKIFQLQRSEGLLDTKTKSRDHENRRSHTNYPNLEARCRMKAEHVEGPQHMFGFGSSQW